MGQKVNPYGFRIGVSTNWNSRWYAGKRDFGLLLVDDQKIRKFVMDQYKFAAIAKVEIERTSKMLRMIIHSARPGIIIGRKGAELNKLQDRLVALTKEDIRIEIREINKPELNAQLVADGVAEQLTKRASYRRTMKRTIEACMSMGALGARINLAGRLGGAEMSRRQSTSEGKIPLTTLRADIDYGFSEAATTFGNIGVKVWIYKGDVETQQETDNGVDAKKG